MSRTLAHPFRLDAAGAVATVEQGTDRHAVEVVRHVVACQIGERALAPEWGIPDPIGEEIDGDVIEAALELCEPDVGVSNVDVTSDGDNVISVVVDAFWRAADE